MAPHLYTQAGKKIWIIGYLMEDLITFIYSQSKNTQRITREATLNLLHPFQPFILGQKFCC